MTNENNKNILFFKEDSMTQLFEALNQYQTDNKKRFLSISIQKDDESFCCIALTNPSEIIIVGGYNANQAHVQDGFLRTYGKGIYE